MKVLSKAAFFIPLSIALTLYTAGCKSNSADNTNTANTGQDQTADAGATDDPANANVIPVSNSTTSGPTPTGGASSPSNQTAAAPLGGSGDTYQAPTANSVSSAYPDYQYNADNGYGQEPETYAQQPPPAMPTYQQPPCPGDGYIWTPGNWNYSSAGYYWVPGAWTMAPYQGALWTPGYWGYRGGRYAYYQGYWGRHIGYYGGINYGFGYVGFGYQGGYWNGNQFAYNRTVNNINTTVVRNVYAYNVRNVTVTNVSYNGGPGGVQYRPHPSELVAIHEQHNPPMAAQVQMVREAQANRNNFATVNRGRPEVLVASRPVAADRGVRPPPVVHYAPVHPAQRVPAPGERPMQAEQRPAEQQRPGTTPQQHAEQQRQEQQQRAEQQKQTQQQQAEQQRQAQQQRAEQQKQAQQQRADQQRQATQQRAEQQKQAQQQRAAQQKQAQQQRAEQQRQQQERKQPEKRPEEQKPQ
jgi:hypothetical protein